MVYGLSEVYVFSLSWPLRRFGNDMLPCIVNSIDSANSTKSILMVLIQLLARSMNAGSEFGRLRTFLCNMLWYFIGFRFKLERILTSSLVLYLFFLINIVCRAITMLSALFHIFRVGTFSAYLDVCKVCNSPQCSSSLYKTQYPTNYGLVLFCDTYWAPSSLVFREEERNNW